MGISSDLQRVIVARLKSAVPAVSGRVYDRRVPESADMPYIAIGAFYGINDGSECLATRTIVAQVDIFASSYPNSAAVSDITDAVVNALDGWTNEAALTMHPLRVTNWDIRSDPDPAALHGLVMIDAMVENDG